MGTRERQEVKIRSFALLIFTSLLNLQIYRCFALFSENLSDKLLRLLNRAHSVTLRCTHSQHELELKIITKLIIKVTLGWGAGATECAEDIVLCKYFKYLHRTNPKSCYEKI